MDVTIDTSLLEPRRKWGKLTSILVLMIHWIGRVDTNIIVMVCGMLGLGDVFSSDSVFVQSASEGTESGLKFGGKVLKSYCVIGIGIEGDVIGSP